MPATRIRSRSTASANPVLEKPQDNSVETVSADHTSTQGDKNDTANHTRKEGALANVVDDSSLPHRLPHSG